MLTISLVSDLHLDVSKYMELPGGDVLLLAGDICEARSLHTEHHQTKVTDRVPGGFPCSDFFEFQVTKYEKVFYVMGNHEHYRGRFDKTRAQLEAIMPPNVTILENEVAEYKGVMFLGATLWTDMNKGDPLSVFTIKDMMNDYRVIQNFYPEKNLYHKLTPDATINVHRKTKEYFKLVLSEHKDKPFVVVTHMSPSFQSVNEKFKHETLSNGGYCSAMEEFVLDNEHIKVWVHGHVHDPVDYMIGETRVLCNPRGYLPWEGGNGFDPAFTFTV